MKRYESNRRETCVICGDPAPAGWTCGNSYCQEADFYLNAARNAGKSKRAPAAWALANQKSSIARGMAARRQDTVNVG